MQKLRAFALSILTVASSSTFAEMIQPQVVLKKTIEKENLALHALSQMDTRNNLQNAQESQPVEATSVMERLNEVATTTVRNFTQTGIASWYGRQFHGRKTASGATFNMNSMTAAHRTLPLNCLIRVTDKNTGKSVVVKVTDRGPFSGDRVLDLSYGAAKALGIVNNGTAKVNIERIK